MKFKHKGNYFFSQIKIFNCDVFDKIFVPQYTEVQNFLI